MKQLSGESTVGRWVAGGALVVAALAVSGCTKAANGGEGSGGLPWSALGGATVPPTATTDPCAMWDKDSATLVKNQLASDVSKIVGSQILDKKIAPGAAVVIGCGEKAILLLGAGNTSYDASAKPVDVGATLYDLASVQKPIIGAAALVLEGKGKMNLAAPVSTYIPGYSGGLKSSVTTEQLLMHRAGMNPFGKDDLPYKTVIANATTPEMVQQNILAVAPRVEAGKTYSYSNIGFSVAGIAIRNAAGQSLENVVQSTVLQPLGMKNTQFNPNPAEKTCAPTSSDYNQEIYTCQVQDLLSRAQGGVAGHAGLFATAEDLSKFASMLAGKGSLNGNQVLTPAQVERMAKNQPDANYGLAVRTNKGKRFGEFMGPQAFGHTGWNGTSFVVDPASKMWMVGLANVSLGQKVDGSNQPLSHYLDAFAAMGESVARSHAQLANQQ